MVKNGNTNVTFIDPQARIKIRVGFYLFLTYLNTPHASQHHTNTITHSIKDNNQLMRLRLLK